MKILQIGTNKASDDLTGIIKRYNPQQIEFLLFVEPLSYCNDFIKKCYGGYNFIIENIAITDIENKNTIDFFTSDKYNRLSSLTEQHIKNHKSNANIKKLQVPCLTINNLLEKYKIKELDILFIDAEGHDYNIIKNLDLKKYKVKEIYYEHIHGENHKVDEYLSSMGYEVSKCGFRDGLTSVGKFIL